MTQHPSLKGSKVGGKFRSVLKRFEKVKDLTEKEKWDEEKNSIYKIPKVRRIKFKVKKTKAAAEGEEAKEGADVANPDAAKKTAPAPGKKEAPASGKKEAGK
ncbi:MAG: small basic protein [Candidatus Omnitrophota bacterium]